MEGFWSAGWGFGESERIAAHGTLFGNLVALLCRVCAESTFFFCSLSQFSVWFCPAYALGSDLALGGAHARAQQRDRRPGQTLESV